MEQKQKTREEIIELFGRLNSDKKLLEYMRVTLEGTVSEAETEARKLIAQINAALRRYEDSGRKDTAAIEEAEERYIACRMLYDALPDATKERLGLKKLPIDDVRYLTQK
jgi:predicted translin family RNA/ssDNA-binding protein